MAQYDRSSKWLIEHHGDAILRLAGISDVVSWRSLQAELVQPGQLPDGLIEAQRTGRSTPTRYVIEIATYPEERLVRQLTRDTLLVYLDQDTLPETLAIVLHPKGRYRVPDTITLRSEDAWTELRVRWHLVELWNVDAAALLATADPGLMPWVPLTRFEGSPEAVLRQCRAVIDQVPAPDERANLLAVTQVLLGLRYNDPQLLRILGGREAMIESPVLKEFEEEAVARGLARGMAQGMAQGKATSILRLLRLRFGRVPEELESLVFAVRDEAILDSLLERAFGCEDLAAFRAALPQ